MIFILNQQQYLNANDAPLPPVPKTQHHGLHQPLFVHITPQVEEYSIGPPRAPPDYRLETLAHHHLIILSRFPGLHPPYPLLSVLVEQV